MSRSVFSEYNLLLPLYEIKPTAGLKCAKYVCRALQHVVGELAITFDRKKIMNQRTSKKSSRAHENMERILPISEAYLSLSLSLYFSHMYTIFHTQISRGFKVQSDKFEKD